MTSVTKVFMFEACHHLPFHDGKCHQLHGHSYKLEVTVSGAVSRNINSPSCGMIIDFADLKDIVNKVVIDKYDHKDLNNYFENPTAEIMVEKFARDIMEGLKDTDIFLKSCRLWETTTSYAEYIPLMY